MNHKRSAAFATLHRIRETCSIALTNLSGKPPIVPDSEEQNVEKFALPILRNDLLSLCLLAYGAVTKVTLSLKPPFPNYSASLTSLRDLADSTAALSNCVLLLSASSHGATIVEEATFTVKDILTAISLYSQTFLGYERDGSLVGDEYLIRTGTVHDLIDKAKELSTDNLSAVRKRWALDRGSLEDGIVELSQMIEQAEGNSTNAEEEDDSGWDEFGFERGHGMDQSELERSKKIHTILRLSNLLHKRIVSDLLTPSVTSHIPMHELDALPKLSATLISTSDDLISSLDSPQDLANVRKELGRFQAGVIALRDVLAASLLADSLARQIEEMKLLDTPNCGRKDSRKWFDTCFIQISGNIIACLAELPEVES